MSDAYRPGQLYTGTDGDLLFVIAGRHGIGFVTDRGTQLTLADVKRAYAPLTLRRDVDGDATELAELAAAVVDALTIPDPDGPDARVEHNQTLALRAAHVRGAMRATAGDGAGAAIAAGVIRRADDEYPATYQTKES